MLVNMKVRGFFGISGDDGTRTLGDSTPDLPLRHTGVVVAVVRGWPCFERGAGEVEVDFAGEGRGG